MRRIEVGHQHTEPPTKESAIGRRGGARLRRSSARQDPDPGSHTMRGCPGAMPKPRSHPTQHRHRTHLGHRGRCVDPQARGPRAHGPAPAQHRSLESCMSRIAMACRAPCASTDKQPSKPAPTPAAPGLKARTGALHAQHLDHEAAKG